MKIVINLLVKHTVITKYKKLNHGGFNSKKDVGLISSSGPFFVKVLHWFIQSTPTYSHRQDMQVRSTGESKLPVGVNESKLVCLYVSTL